MSDATLPLVSVVLPTCRRPALLQRCLNALMAQCFAFGRYEIVVVDDGPDAATRELVQALAAQDAFGRLRYLRPAHGRGPAVARNAGWRAARAPLVAFTDDDTVPDAYWLAEGWRAMRANPAWVAASGAVQVPPAKARGRRPTDHELMTQALERCEFVTANAFVRRDALEALGGFDERFTRPWREDSDLQFRLLARGPVGHASLACVQHPVRPERWGVSLRQQRNSFFDALLYKKHPRLYRQRIRRVPPWDYYLMVALALSALPLGLLAGGRAALAALAGALALGVALALRRLRHTDRSPAHVAEMLLTSMLIPFLSVYWRLLGALRFRVLFL